MDKQEFENILDDCYAILTDEARKEKLKTAMVFESRVREVLANLAKGEDEIDSDPHPQALPDIEIGEYGVEVKFTLSDAWRSVANCILGTQRIGSVKSIYIIFGKMGGIPKVCGADYEDGVMHVRTSHAPCFEIEIGHPSKTPLFDEMGIPSNDRGSQAAALGPMGIYGMASGVWQLQGLHLLAIYHQLDLIVRHFRENIVNFRYNLFFFFRIANVEAEMQGIEVVNAVIKHIFIESC